MNGHDRFEFTKMDSQMFAFYEFLAGDGMVRLGGASSRTTSARRRHRRIGRILAMPKSTSVTWQVSLPTTFPARQLLYGVHFPVKIYRLLETRLDSVGSFEDMALSSQRFATREKLILAGLYLSKFDSLGLKKLGLESFVEAFNVIGYAMGSRPASIKNYRDEFDPLFPNRRKGWHKRPIRDYCLKVFEQYKSLDLESFTGLVKSLVGYDENVWSEVQAKEDLYENESYFARLITGLAAERYFEEIQPRLPEFSGFVAENTTRFGCGYDFRLRTETSKDFLVVEVKGLRERVGSLSLTPKEHEVADALRDRFFLFVVKNFQESPFHEIFKNPLSSRLLFRKSERVTVYVSWLANV
jgi:hypothetical protein